MENFSVVARNALANGEDASPSLGLGLNRLRAHLARRLARTSIRTDEHGGFGGHVHKGTNGFYSCGPQE